MAIGVRCEWDEQKNRANRKKHGISFETASQVFDDPFVQTRFDRLHKGEDRLQTLGRIESLVVLLVVHTWRDHEGEEFVRIISARKATPRERRSYEEAKFE